MKNLKTLAYQVKPAIPESNSLTVVNDKIYYYDENNVEHAISSSDGGGADLMINTTHADLLALVNNSGLVAGQQYRITDYVTTVSESVYAGDSSPFARSNNHAFDIIVTADSTNKLNENARAIRHEGDTYFPLHTKFEAWQIKYMILNDSDRFRWALSSGKGVIYQLIDEWNNDLPYDFKSIQFKRNDNWVYTFGGNADGSLELGNCYNNTLLNNRGFLNNNTFGNYCSSNMFGDNCQSNTFGDNCYSNTFGNGCSFNSLGNICNSNTFRDDCYSNVFGDDCSSNNFGNGCSSNTFGNICNLNNLSNTCNSNIFGNYCSSNNFGNYCYSNTFGEGCSSNNFGNYCYSNTFGNICNLNNLSNTCNSNIFGNYCSSNNFITNCSSNTLGESCRSNTLRESCDFNTIGNDCNFNTFKHNCSFNNFGNNYKYFNLDFNISGKDFTTLISLFTTPPSYNEIKVTKTPGGIVMSQVINATTTESINI